ncbi:MAG: CehA/McbA family metallohydrolase [Acidobacteriota bacterium]
MSPLRYPPVRGGQIRIEGYLVLAVTSWPAYPAWSPDGRQIAFTMDGQIWRVPAGGGEATQITDSPGYDFEPDWSPDGKQITFSRDLEGNLDVYVVSLESGRSLRLSYAPQLEFHPRWSADGKVVFASATSGDFDIFQVRPDGTGLERIVSGPGNQIQPDPSPIQPGRLVMVSSRSGRVGAGGLWLVDGPREREIHFEETSYRTRPAWSPDGEGIAFVSHREGSNDIWLLRAAGGLPFRLTRDSKGDEFAPAWSRDGERLVYVTNRSGHGALETVAIHGGPVRPPIEGLSGLRPHGLLKVNLSGPARVSIQGSDHRFHAPRHAFRRVVSFTETHYFHASGPFQVEVPEGRTEIFVSRGPEWLPLVRSVVVPAGGAREISIRLKRLADLAKRGWYSGDTHVRVVNALIHIDGTRLMGDLSRFRPGRHPASTDRVLLRYGQEYRMPFGHRTFLNLQGVFFPLVSGLRGTVYEAPFPPLFEYLRRIRGDQPSVLAGIPHPYFGYLARGELPRRGAPSEIPVNVALGLVDFFDVNCIWSDERGSAQIYARLLNSGFRLAAAGGSDTFSDLWRDPPLGTGRTYVKVEGPLTLENWYARLKRGHSFSTNGPLLELRVNGRGMGEQLRVDKGALVRVQAKAICNVAMEKLSLLVNGRAVQVVQPDRQTGIRR